MDRGHQPPAPAGTNGDDPWKPINGSEQVILGDLSILADGDPVEVAPATDAAKVASAAAPGSSLGSGTATWPLALKPEQIGHRAQARCLESSARAAW